MLDGAATEAFVLNSPPGGAGLQVPSFLFADSGRRGTPKQLASDMFHSMMPWTKILG